MAHGTLRTSSKKNVTVEIDDNDIEQLWQGSLRVLRVKAVGKIDNAPGFYSELEVNGESLVVIDVTPDKRGTGALVTVR